ncbi:MAG: hypothetical protein U0401_05755 [Anaerolineae bacterium]
MNLRNLFGRKQSTVASSSDKSLNENQSVAAPGRGEPITTRYKLENIHTLLVQGFSTDELRYLIFDTPDFRPIYDQLAERSSKVEIVDRLLEYAHQKPQLVETLLTLAEKYSPARYKRHLPYLAEGSETTPVKSSRPSTELNETIQAEVWKQPTGDDQIMIGNKAVHVSYQLEYHTANIRKLLQEAFTIEELLGFIQNSSDFKSVKLNLPHQASQNQIIPFLIEEAERTAAVETLLKSLKALKPAEYEHYQPYFGSRLSINVTLMIQGDEEQLKALKDGPLSHMIGQKVLDTSEQAFVEALLR